MKTVQTATKANKSEKRHEARKSVQTHSENRNGYAAAKENERFLEVRTTYPCYGKKYFFHEGDRIWETDRIIAMDFIRENYVPGEFKSDFLALTLPKMKELLAEQEKAQRRAAR